ncbi:DUF4932 domain-containing protein [Thermococcus sp. M39]|uniref:DUF4932 domain-containing protein n=1 Tax=unclassified Thermococcus TaxID=2627626 RepID=UPI0014387399|nr:MULTISPECIES: DUF4932 domain-containing protein [unclassified Thermococcus]NJE07964.1 DUF4932 domain-containing protein [Thermococcus sp. M39]NJE13662.1 DUF4932 domain-containing protein [Thermococcus sp. LS2]
MVVSVKKASLILCFLLLISQTPLIKAEEQPQVVVEVNPNLELFAVVYILAFNGSDEFIIAPQSYVDDVLTYFAPHKDHMAVKSMRQMFPKNLPNYVKDENILNWASSLAVMDYLGDKENLSDFYAELSDFAKESNFIEFYNAHREEYEKALTPIEDIFKELDFIEKLENRSGKKYNEYRVELSYSLFIHLHSRQTVTKAYMIGSVPWSYLDNLRYTGLPNIQAIKDYMFRAFFIHEFAHAFLDSDRLGMSSEYRFIYQKVLEELPFTAYNLDFSTSGAYLNENLVEAFTHYYLAEHYNSTIADYSILKDATHGYVLVWDLAKAFQENISFSQIPEVVGKLVTKNNLSRYFNSKMPVNGFWAANRIYTDKSVIIVYGTQNPDKSGNEYDKETALMLADKLRSAGILVEVKSDKELTNENLRSNLIVIGGPAANELTRSLIEKLAVKFSFNGDWEIVRNFTAVENPISFIFSNGSIKVVKSDAPVPEEYPLGVVQTLRNPWNNEKFIIVIAGVDRYCTRKMLRYFNYNSSYLIKGRSFFEEGFYFQVE